MYIQKDMKAQMQEVIGKISTDLTLSADSATYIEELYEQYLLAPETLSEDWQRYFGQFPQGDQPHGPIKQQFLDLARTAHRGQNIENTEVSPEQQLRQIAVIKLIAAYRHRGHQKAKLDPLGLAKREYVAELELATHGLTQADLATFFYG